MGWKWVDQIALDMPTLFDNIEEEALKVENSEIEEVITVGEHTRVRRPKEQYLCYDYLPKVDEYLSVMERKNAYKEISDKRRIGI